MNRPQALAKAARVRKTFVEQLALTDVVRWVALYGCAAEVAAAAGVAEDVIHDAIKQHFGQKEREPLHLRRFTITVPGAIGDPLFGMARRMRMSIAGLARSLMHAAMLTTREPTRREGLDPQTEGARAFRTRMRRPSKDWRGFPDRHQRKRTTLSRRFIRMGVTSGLTTAIERRAAAFGMPVGNYYVAWFADLVDGLLSDLVVEPVRWDQVYAFPENYVLPVLRSPAP